MSIRKHTPGPWICTNYGMIECSSGEIIATTHSNGFQADGEEDANGCLIAAAPDLLEACQAIAALVNGQGYQNMVMVAAQASAAIAKAENKS